MKAPTLLAALALLAVAGALAARPATAADGLKGWILAGSAPREYAIATDPAVRKAGRASGVLRALRPQVDGFGTLMQTFSAQAYLGKRVRFSALVKAQQVVSWAGLWMRVDGQTKSGIAFDNMQDRPIKGTLDWRRYEVVLPVAADADAISLGILLDGGGRVWLDDVKVEVLGDADQRTPARPAIPARPQNLGFDE